MSEFWFGVALGFGGGGCLVWFCKSSLQKMVIGANALSAKLHAEANTLSAQASTIKKAL